MIEVWTWPTPNGHKVHITLEELGLPYKVIPVNISKASVRINGHADHPSTECRNKSKSSSTAHTRSHAS